MEDDKLKKASNEKLKERKIRMGTLFRSDVIDKHKNRMFIDW